MKQKIMSIRFDHVDKNSGCTCNKCGQYIQNVWTVSFAGGLVMNYGIDCFEKVYKSGTLTAQGIKEFRKLLKSIQDHKEGCDKWKNITESEARANSEKWGMKLCIDDPDNAFYGCSFEEYREWMVNEFFGERFRQDEKALVRFRAAGFDV